MLTRITNQTFKLTNVDVLKYNTIAKLYLLHIIASLTKPSHELQYQNSDPML